MNVIYIDRKRFEHLDRWMTALEARPGVQKGCPELPPIMKSPGHITLTPERFSKGFGEIMHAANRAD